MNGKSAYFILEIYKFHSSLFVISRRIHIEFYALALQIRKSAEQVIGTDTDMPLAAGAYAFHDFKTAARKIRGAGFPLGKTEQTGNCIGGILCCRLIRLIDADMNKRESQHLFHSLSCQIPDRVKIPRVDQIGIDHPAAAAGDDFREVKITVQIARVDPACRHKF